MSINLEYDSKTKQAIRITLKKNGLRGEII